MKDFKLTKAVIASVDACSKDATREVLNSVFVSKDGKTTACNGHILVHVSPALVTLDPLDLPNDGLLLHSADIARAKAVFQKESPVLSVDGESLSIIGDMHRLKTRKYEGKDYPGTTKIMPKGKPKYEISLNADTLHDLMGIIKKAIPANSSGSRPVTLSFYLPTEPVAFKSEFETPAAEIVSGLIMPCHSEKATGLSE